MSSDDPRVPTELLASAGVPVDREHEYLDVADLPPPEPMSETLERLAELPADAIFVQANDREPQFLFPKLEDRGFVWESVTLDDDTVVTAIWKPA